MRRSSVLCSVAAVLCLTVAVRGDVELVRDGKLLADIVVATNALSSVRLAAQDLQKHIELMSGARLPITNAISDTVRNHVYVGESELTRRGPGRAEHSADADSGLASILFARRCIGGRNPC